MSRGRKTQVGPTFTTYHGIAGDRGCVVLGREQPGSPSGVVTFLFTDIEGSTREVLGNEVYESSARTDEHMTTAEMVAYAFEQSDRARTLA